MASRMDELATIIVLGCEAWASVGASAETLGELCTCEESPPSQNNIVSP